MQRLRLIADDLTGALDTAAQFVGLTGAVPVFWPSEIPDDLPPSAAVDSGTRELVGAQAAVETGKLAGLLDPRPGVIAYLKLDSLLRGHSGRELAACLRAVPVRHCIVSPAFPFQGRVTRGGLQHVHGSHGWRQVGEDLRATLAAEGLEVRLARPGEPVPEGISLWDAETDDDLRRVAEAGKRLDAPVLWCGSGGLAGVLADRPCAVSPLLRRPLLGLFGSDHPVTTAQLATCGSQFLRVPDGGAPSAGAAMRQLARTGAALIGFDLPARLDRASAARLIAREMAALTLRLPAPRSLVVAGGETLRALCASLGTGHLELLGQIMPGVPRSVMRGGRWDGIDVVSKSGAFGEPGLLRDLVATAAPAHEGGER